MVFVRRVEILIRKLKWIPKGHQSGCDSSFIWPLKDSILRQPDNDLEATFTEWLVFFFLLHSSFLYSHPQVVPPALLVKKFDQVLFHVLLGQNENANEYAQNVLRPTFCGIFVFPTWHLWSHWTQFLVLQYPGSSVYRVPEVFLARGGNFRCWPKAEATNRTETALRKVSGTQEVKGSNPVQAWIFSGFLSQLRKTVSKCDDLLSYNSADFV